MTKDKRIIAKQKELLKVKDQLYEVKLQLEGYQESMIYTKSYEALSHKEDDLHKKEIALQSELSAIEAEPDEEYCACIVDYDYCEEAKYFCSNCKKQIKEESK